MKAIITFSEIQSLVKSKTGREIGLSAIDERIVKAEAKVSVKVPFLGEIEKSIEVNVSVDKIEGNDVHLKYEGGMGTDMIIGGVLSFLSATPAVKMVERAQGSRMVGQLNVIKEAQKVLEMVKRVAIWFNGSGICIEGKIR